MAMTLRLPEELLGRGQRYAGELGISLNGLLAVALRDYLDSRAPELRMAPPLQAVRKVPEALRFAASASAPVGLARAIASKVKGGPSRRR